MKTLIELFDMCPLENVAASMAYKPEKIIFIGFKSMMTEKRRRNLERFFEMKKINAAVEYEYVGRYDFEGMVGCLRRLVDRNNDCWFDITGGRELPLVAMGVMSAECRIPLFQFNIKGGAVVPLKNCETLPDAAVSQMSIEECIALNGGMVVDYDREATGWRIDKEFRQELDSIWSICRKNSTLWNRQSKVLAGFGQNSPTSDGLSVCISRGRFNAETDEALAENGIISNLRRAGIVVDYEDRGGEVRFRYKNAQVHKVLSKAGNILELYTYMTAKEMSKREGEKVFCDADMGVYIDWDGVVHRREENEKDTVNEVDVMLMRGVRPVFISCKNGEVKKEALYELATVAERFGGRYAVRILVCTHIGGSAQGRRYMLQRARDMRINVIEGVDSMTRAEFESKLEKFTR